jgi:serine/threonine-protein kinase RsbW
MTPVGKSEPLGGQGTTLTAVPPSGCEAIRPCPWPDIARTAAVECVLLARYPGVPEAIQVARRDAATALHGVPAAEDAVYCLSEIATNAIVHSRSGDAGGFFTVATDVLPGELVLIAVADQGGLWKDSQADTYLHGLAIVNEMSAAIRVDGNEDSRTVWVRFSWAAT